MLRLAIRLFITPLAILLLDLVIAAPIAATILTVVGDMAIGKFDEPLDILERVGVVLIGWGVALEERSSLREIFRTSTPDREAFEAALDSLCHSCGVGLLIFGLFSEIAIAAIKLPNHITPTEGFDPVVLGFSALFIALGGVVLAVHIFRLAAVLLTGRPPAAHS